MRGVSGHRRDAALPPADAAPANYQVMVRPVSEAEDDRLRAEIVGLLLRQHIAGLKAQLDQVSWQNGGYAELEAFIEALLGGGGHPLLSKWTETRARSGRPAPSSRESYARRVAVLMCEALRRAGLSRRAARRFAAKELGRGGIDVSAKIIEHWAERDYPLPTPLAPSDELFVSTGLATSSGAVSRDEILRTTNDRPPIRREAVENPPERLKGDLS
jgi:hypothetical protein